MIATTELDELKTRDLPALVGRYTTLHRASGREFAGPCPRAGCDADTDGFHVGRGKDGSWWWFCRKCHERRGDAVEFARWLLGYDFATAVEWVRGGVAVVQPSTPRTPAQPVATARAWDVHQVEREIDAGARALGGDGELGRAARAYLGKRGITLATADRFFVGAHDAWDRQLKHARPALALPWAVADVALLRARVPAQRLQPFPLASARCVPIPPPRGLVRCPLWRHRSLARRRARSRW